MASAHLKLPTAEEEELVERHEDSEMPAAIMPYREYSGKELDGKHPSLVPPDDEALEDTERRRRLCSAIGKNSPSVSGKILRIADGSRGRPTQPSQPSAA